MQPPNQPKIHLPAAFYLRQTANLPNQLNIEIDGVIQQLAVQWIERALERRAPCSLPAMALQGKQFYKMEWHENCQLYFQFDMADLVAFQCGKELTVKSTPSEMFELMHLHPSGWNIRGTYLLNEKIIRYHAEIIGEKIQTIGFYEKYAWEKGSQIATIGDIHGNDGRLMRNLIALRDLGFLDDNFCCRPNKYVIFLGDYVDRGNSNLKVLELVLTLKLENPQQVHLIRGNHEDLNTTLPHLEEYAKNDPSYRTYLSDLHNVRLISLLYSSLPLAVYVCQKTDAKVKEYMQFCHGLFHLYTDPAPFLKSDQTRYWLSNDTAFSLRVQSLLRHWLAAGEQTPKAKKQKKAASRLIALANTLNIDVTNLYWLDIGKTFKICPLTQRTKIPPKTIKAYLQMCSTDSHKIKEIVRGHQGKVKMTHAYGKIVAITLDPSTDPEYQTYLEIKLAEKIHHCRLEFLQFEIPYSK